MLSMTTKDLHVNVWDLIFPLAQTVDMMNPAVAEHHMRVAYLAMRLAEELEIDPTERRDITVAGALHDIGAFSLHERLDVLEFEETKPAQHCRAGYLLLKDFPPFAQVAAIIRYHHLPWNHGKGATEKGEAVPKGAHILHLADRIAVLISSERPVLSQMETIRESILPRVGELFVPEYVDAFERLASKDYIWLEAVSESISSILKRSVGFQNQGIDVNALLEFARLICRIIDFKSEFTATHSSGVAATATALGRWIGFSAQECRMLQIAAYLHDLGKLAIPSEILEKPGKLTTDEWQLMRTHVYYTYRVLEPIDALNVITSWGALHQERLNGTGYPFRYKAEDLPLGARIMAVADVFTGITEDRPYRKGMDKETALAVLENMAECCELDASIISVLDKNFDETNELRAKAQETAIQEYEAFREALG
jgi:HD-GYP domain-containing protein (c-di-GMP phosphodiesterase class II)